MIRTGLFFLVLTNFWNYNPSSNELEYWVKTPHSPYFTCGFISYSAAGEAGRGVSEGYMTDITRPRDSELIGSKWFNTMAGAKKFVEKECEAK